MSAVDQINETKIVTLSGIETKIVSAIAGGGDVDAQGILKANRHQIDVEGSLTVSFRIKGHTNFHGSTVVADASQTFSLVNVDQIKLVSAAGTPSANLVSYSER